MQKKEFTNIEQKEIRSNLRKRLHPELLSTRTGFNNMKLTYLEGWQAIELANRIFGFNGWSSELKSIDVESDVINNRFFVYVTCVARVTLKDGTYREDTGFGSAENQKIRGMAAEKARKEAATDALKRALRQFGNALGNCCYDKKFLKDLQLNRDIGVDMIRKKDNDQSDVSMSFDEFEEI